MLKRYVALMLVFSILFCISACSKKRIDSEIVSDESQTELSESRIEKSPIITDVSNNIKNETQEENTTVPSSNSSIRETQTTAYNSTTDIISETNDEKYDDPPYGTVVTEYPTGNYSTWGWAVVSWTYVWKIDEYGGWWEGSGYGRYNGAPMSSEKYDEWNMFAKGMVAEPERDGKYVGEKITYKAYVWLNNESDTKDYYADTYPVYGTVVTKDPRSTHEGGFWGWESQTLIWKWIVDENGGFWNCRSQKMSYSSDEISDEWNKYAYSYVEAPQRDGKYEGEEVVKSAWVWLKK